MTHSVMSHRSDCARRAPVQVKRLHVVAAGVSHTTVFALLGSSSLVFRAKGFASCSVAAVFFLSSCLVVFPWKNSLEGHSSHLTPSNHEWESEKPLVILHLINLCKFPTLNTDTRSIQMMWACRFLTFLFSQVIDPDIMCDVNESQTLHRKKMCTTSVYVYLSFHNNHLSQTLWCFKLSISYKVQTK